MYVYIYFIKYFLFEQSSPTPMLVAIAVAFLVLVCPISVGHYVSHALEEPFFESQRPLMVNYRRATLLMEFLNYSSNFLLYIICGATYRKEAGRLVWAPIQKIFC